jgi:hypothetical protein
MTGQNLIASQVYKFLYVSKSWYTTLMCFLHCIRSLRLRTTLIHLSLLLALIYGVLNKFHKVISSAMVKSRKRVTAHTGQSFGLEVQHWLQTSVMIYHVISRALLHTFLYKNLRLTVCGTTRPTNEQSRNTEPSIPASQLRSSISDHLLTLLE